MIEGIDITKRFDEKVLFEHLNFKIETGEFACFSGKSGAGKTTLLNMIGQIEGVDAGKILINEKEMKSGREKREYFRRQAGFLFQNFALIENKTVKQNLKIIRKHDRTSLSIEDALGQVGLEDKLNKKVFTLSGGEQQRVALARLFLKQCEIILADEPTGSLDRENANLVMDTLEQLHKQGKTIILVTHDELVKQRAERIITL